jgi:hypothetical protein
MSQDTENTTGAVASEAAGPMARKGNAGSFFSRRLFEARYLATRMPRVVRLARLTTFLVCLAAIGSSLYVHRVHSQMGEQLVSAGELMMRYDNAERQDHTRVMEVNGQTIQFSSGVTTDSVDQILDNFESICQTHDGQVMEQFARSPEHVLGHAARTFDPVMRYGGANGGVVVCLDMGEEEVSLSELRRRIDRFEATTDVHEIGNIRYVYVQGTDDPEIRHFITVWTNGPFRLGNMVADGADAPGTDLADVPRPPGARRVMSAAEQGHPEAAVMYRGSSMTEWELEGYYQQQLPEHGWVLTPIQESYQPQHTRVVSAHRPDHSELLVISLDTDAHGRGSATLALSR